MGGVIVFLSFFGFLILLVNSQLYSNESCDLQNRPIYKEPGIILMEAKLYHKAELGSNFTLSCEYHNYCYIKWYHGDLEMYPTANGRVQLANMDQELVITNITEDDVGEYSCSVYNDTDRVTSTGFLSVNGFKITELAIIEHEIDGYNYVESQITLFCRAVNHDKMTWYHNGELIDPLVLKRYEFGHGGIELYIQPTKLEDRGEYTCVASNSTRNVSRSGKVRISCISGDVILINCSGYNITAPLGSNLTVECTFNVGAGHVLLESNWFKVNGTATDVYNRSSWVIPIFFDFNGARVDIRRYTVSKKYDSDCFTKYHTIRMDIFNITDEVYGYYIVRVKKGNNQHLHLIVISREENIPIIVKIAAVIAPSGIFFVISALIFVTWKTYHLDIKLLVKDVNFKSREGTVEDGKVYDVYISCSDDDVRFVVNMLLPLLQEKGYTTCLRVMDFTPGDSNNDAIWRYLNASRCCLLIVSPGMFGQNLVQTEMQAATEIFSDHKHGVIPIMFDNVSEADINQSPVLKHYLASNHKLLLKKEDRLNLKTLRKSSIFKEMRLAFPSPSDKRPTRGRGTRMNREGIDLLSIQN